MVAIPTQTVGIAFVSLLLGVGVTALYYKRVALNIDEEVRELEEEAYSGLDEDDDTGFGVEMRPPAVSRNVFDVFKVWLHLSKGARMAKRGYLKWYRVDSRLQSPMWIKPEKKGTGEYEYYSKKDDQTYIFPEDALVTDAATGAWVAVHKVGEAEPITLRDPGWPAIDGDRLQTLFDLAISRPPDDGFGLGFLSGKRAQFVLIAVLGIGIWGVMQMGVIG